VAAPGPHTQRWQHHQPENFRRALVNIRRRHRPESGPKDRKQGGAINHCDHHNDDQQNPCMNAHQVDSHQVARAPKPPNGGRATRPAHVEAGPSAGRLPSRAASLVSPLVTLLTVTVPTASNQGHRSGIDQAACASGVGSPLRTARKRRPSSCSPERKMVRLKCDLGQRDQRAPTRAVVPPTITSTPITNRAHRQQAFSIPQQQPGTPHHQPRINAEQRRESALPSPPSTRGEGGSGRTCPSGGNDAQQRSR